MKALAKLSLMAFVVLGSAAVPVLAQARTPSPRAMPTRLTISRVGLFGISVPKFADTVTQPGVVRQLYRQLRALPVRPLHPTHGVDNGVPPLGWDTGWGVALELTFWHNGHRLLTVVDTGPLPLYLSQHHAAYLLLSASRIDTKALDRPSIYAATNPGKTARILHEVYNLLPMSSRKFFHRAAALP
ncbi:MAG: hypothetical protein OWU84_04045 [Firmicutes bacterium]|nr:hypothetical protein [Bacillota bacterium]